MADRSPHLAEALTELLPELPGEDEFGFALEGRTWIEALPQCGWHAVEVWGSQGWNLGLWPHQIIAHYDPPLGTGVYGIATYVEGDITVEAFESRHERDGETNESAVWFWRSNENGPKDLPSEDASPLPEYLCGPYTGPGL